jgi:hypothetical protein
MALAIAMGIVLVGLFAKRPDDRLAIGIVGAGCLAGLILWLVPKWQVTSLRSLKPAELFEQENEARRTLAQIIGGIVILAGLYFTSWNIKIAQTSADEARNAATESRELTRQGQITDRFTKAIDQLGEIGKDKTPGPPGRNLRPRTN